MTKKKIMVVEDEQALLTLQSMLLSMEDYTVEGVMDGQTALDVVETMKPDLILLDIMLPEVDGFQVCRQLKSNEATRHTGHYAYCEKEQRRPYHGRVSWSRQVHNKTIQNIDGH